MNVRKIVAGLAAVSMLAAFSAQAAFAADSVTIKAGKVVAAPGSDFTLDISLDAVPAQGISAIELAVTYDPSVVTVSGVTAGNVTNNGVDDAESFSGVTVFEVGKDTAGLVTVTYSTGLSEAKYCITDSGVFATISGTVKADAAEGTYPVEIKAIPRETVEGSGTNNTDVKAGYIDASGAVTKYGTTLSAGSITVSSDPSATTPSEEDTTAPNQDTTAPKDTEPGQEDTKPNNPDTPAGVMYGDTNCDGAVDIMDVITLNKFLLGSGALTDNGKANADVDANDAIDTTDSLNILKCVVEMIQQSDFPL